MHIQELIERQRSFDRRRVTTFEWSMPITKDESSALTHNALSLAGEVGELANLVKKYDRGDFDFETLVHELPNELSDILIYVLKIAYQANIDLERAVSEKMSSNELRFPPRDDS